MIQVQTDVTIRTIRIVETGNRDLKEHEAINRASAWIREAGGPPVDSWAFLDVDRKNYNVVDVNYRYRFTEELVNKGG